MPGPGAYNEGPKLGEKTLKISMQGRTPNHCIKIIFLIIYYIISAFDKLEICSRARGL